MYRITTPSGETFLTEKPNFIRVHSNGTTFLLTDRERAEGVAHHGTPYLWKDGAICYEVDAGGQILESYNAYADLDRLGIEQEYRLTLLELGLSE